MTPGSDGVGRAAAFQAETDALLTLERWIERIMRERRRAQMAFDGIAAAVDLALAKGEAPLGLIDKLGEANHAMNALECELAGKLEEAAKFFSARP